jgi:hypothetical protein
MEKQMDGLSHYPDTFVSKLYISALICLDYYSTSPYFWPARLLKYSLINMMPNTHVKTPVSINKFQYIVKTNT